MTSFSKSSMKMHTGLFLLFTLCLCTAEEHYALTASTNSKVPEDDQINDVDHDVHEHNLKSTPYSQSRIKTSALITTKSFVKADQVHTTTLPDITRAPHDLIYSRYAPDKQLMKVSTRNTGQTKFTSVTWKEEKGEDALDTSDSDSELFKLSPVSLSRVKHQQSNKNLPQLDTESSSIATDDAEPGTVEDEVRPDDGGEESTPTFPTDEEGSSSPQPPHHNGHVDIKISIPHIFHLSLGDTADGRRQLGIEAPFFRLDLTRPRFKVFKK